MMESNYLWNVYHKGMMVARVSAGTKWEAIERAMHQTNWQHDRAKLIAKKVW
jgi:hypothetical protein